MDQQELKKLKTSLVAEAELIENQLGEFTTDNPTVNGDRRSHFHETDPSDSPSDKAHSVTEFEEDRAIEQNLEVRLREIKNTIKKIDEGAYGVCEKCTSTIDVRRLKVVPAARFCFDCGKRAQFV